MSIAPRRWVAVTVLLLVGTLFCLPLAAMLEFSLRSGAGSHGIEHWTALVDPQNARTYRNLFQGMANSLVLALATIAIVLLVLLPTMVLVRLRLRRLERVLEFLCTLPITVPAVVLVVGYAPVYQVVSRVLGSSPWTLAFAYGVLCLPFAYRALHASISSVDLVTVTEAARSLGSSPIAVFFRVVLPVLRRGVIAASFISLAVVLGEFTVASLLNRLNLQTSLVQVSQSDPYAAVIVSLLSLLLVFLLLLILGRVESAAQRKKEGVQP